MTAPSKDENHRRRQAARISRRAFDGRVRVYGVHDQLNPYVVCFAEQALVQPSKRGIRSGLDDLIRTDGFGVVPHMAVAAKSYAGYGDRSFCGTACSQRYLDVRVFWIAKHTLRLA